MESFYSRCKGCFKVVQYRVKEKLTAYLRCFYAEDLTFVCFDLSNFQVNQTLARSPAQPRATCGETFNDHQTSQDQDQEAYHHHRQLTRPQLRVWSVF